jgi:hypothetical protein
MNKDKVLHFRVTDEIYSYVENYDEGKNISERATNLILKGIESTTAKYEQIKEIILCGDERKRLLYKTRYPEQYKEIIRERAKELRKRDDILVESLKTKEDIDKNRTISSFSFVIEAPNKLGFMSLFEWTYFLFWLDCYEIEYEMLTNIIDEDGRDFKLEVSFDELKRKGLWFI